MNRRRFSGFACLSLLGASLPGIGQTRSGVSLRMVIAFAAGGSADTIGRIVADGLSSRLGRPVIPDNRPGATGTIGTGFAAKAEGDGNTILMSTSSSHYSAYLYDSVPYSVEKDFVPIAGIAVIPLLVVARPGLPARSINELIALAKASPKKLTYASPGSGGAAHLATEMFMRTAGIQMLHVPYKSVAAGVVDVMGDRVDVMFDGLSTSGPHVRAGRLKALGVTGLTRSASMPDVPTVSESIAGFEATYWMAIFAPATTPPDLVKRLNAEINAVLNSESIRQRILEIGGVMKTGTPLDFGEYLVADTEKWRRIIKETGARVD